MQDIQNIPNPDTSPNNDNEDFGSHSQVNPENDIENPAHEGDTGEQNQTPDTNDFPSQEDPEAAEEEPDLL